MRADRMRVTVLSSPLERDQTVPMSFGSLADRRMCLVEIEADGVVGIGESWINYPTWAPRERLATLCDGIAPLVVGHDISDPRQVHRDIAERLLPLGRQWGAPGPVWQALSGVDVALWDLWGKRAGRSVAELLGAREPRRSVPVYASGVGPTQVRALCESALETGLHAVKTKIGFGMDPDVATLSEARSVIGSHLSLFADANQAWDLAEAIAMSETLTRHGVEWLEEPLDGDNLDDLEALAAKTTASLATGENVYGLTEFGRYVNSTAIRIIQPDLTKCGGFTVAAEVAEHASQTGTAVAPHCYGGAVGLAASLQLATAFPAVRWLEYDVRRNPLRTDVLAPPLPLDAGHIVTPHAPGLGVELDPEVVDHYRTHTEERAYHDL